MCVLVCVCACVLVCVCVCVLVCVCACGGVVVVGEGLRGFMLFGCGSSLTAQTPHSEAPLIFSGGNKQIAFN